MAYVHTTETAEFFDLDGTCTDFDVTPYLAGKAGSPEVAAYCEASVEYIIEKIPALSITPDELLPIIKQKMKDDVFPKRSTYEFWATFHTAQNGTARICPAVDVYLMNKHAVHIYLAWRMKTAAPGSVLHKELAAFLEDPQWGHSLFHTSNSVSGKKATIDDDALGALEDRLEKNALVAILSNSKSYKARQLLEQAGFGRYIADDHLERGKIAIVGDCMKYLTDTEWPQHEKPSPSRFGDFLDLSAFFKDVKTPLDLRRRHFYTIVQRLMNECGAKRAWIASDVACLDLFPFANWTAFNPIVAMRTSRTSAEEEILAVRELLGGCTSEKLSDLTASLN